MRFAFWVFLCCLIMGSVHAQQRAVKATDSTLSHAECNCKNIMAVAKLVQDNRDGGLGPEVLYTRIYGSFPFAGFETVKNTCMAYMRNAEDSAQDFLNSWNYGEGFTQVGKVQFLQDHNSNNPWVVRVGASSCVASTPEPTLVPLDECACKTLKHEYGMWFSDPVFGEFGNKALTFPAWLYKKHGITISLAEYMLNSCEDAFYSGAGYDKNNTPKASFTANSIFEWQAQYNLNQWAEDLNYKVPKFFACSRATATSNCYDNMSCETIQQLLKQEIKKLQENDTARSAQIGLSKPIEHSADTLFERYFCDILAWNEALEIHVLGENGFHEGSMEFARVVFLKELLLKFRSIITCTAPAKQASDYTLKDFLKIGMSCLPPKAWETFDTLASNRILQKAWTDDFVKFLNHVGSKNNMSRVDRLVHTSWYLEADIRTQVLDFADSKLYAGGADRSNLQYLIHREGSSPNFMPNLAVQIKDEKGFSLKYTLGLTSNLPYWNYYYIMSFENPRPVLAGYRGTSQYFIIDAQIMVPATHWKDEQGNALAPFTDCPNYAIGGAFLPVYCYRTIPVLVEITEYTGDSIRGSGAD